MNHELQARVRDIRAGLPGQLRQQRLRTAALLYGPLYSLDEVHARLARTLPWRWGWLRRVRVEAIERADTLLPDEVLLAYDDAVQAGVFSRFLVATPSYYWRAAAEFWLVAEVQGTGRWAILAHGRDEARLAA
ncbi:MAG TPA: hypothetical protein VFL90_11695 [Methylomirabilota bacterium]|nr:hypothetical protein [Methylomirabilota bacterium]